MRGLVAFVVLASVSLVAAQKPTTPDPSKDPVYVCPMDPDVRSHNPGVCTRCGMKLTAGIPEPVAFHLGLAINPQPPKPEQPATLTFLVHDPWKDRPVKSFILVHEKLFHAFVVSQDLEFFEHGHATMTTEGMFQFPVTFPKPGMFRVLGDFYPDGATPQLIAKTVFVPGRPPAAAKIGRDYSTKTAQNLQASLETVPPQPIAGTRTQMRFTINPSDGFEKYLGAWAHMLAVSDDLIDMMHEHPFIADGGPQIEFRVVFPRARTYRVWVQFQRNSVVNTVHFDVPARSLE
jgi:hypothetical protein